MKWIELNDGKLLNLKQIEFIRVEEHTKRTFVRYESSSGITDEIFDTPEEAENRMNMLKQMLI